MTFTTKSAYFGVIPKKLNSSILMKKFLAFLFLVSSVFLSSCKDDYCSCVAPPSESTLAGQWKWVRTVMPGKTETAEKSATSRDVNFFFNNGLLNVTFYQNDTLKATLVQTGAGPANDVNAGVVMKFSTDGYLRIKRNMQEIEIGELMKTYSEKADTIRHFYEFAGAPRKEL